MSQRAEKLVVDPAIIRQATRLVLGTHTEAESSSAIRVLTKETLNVSFRRRAMMFHPDRADQLGIDPGQLNELFKRFHGAYRLLGRLIDGDIVPFGSTSGEANPAPPGAEKHAAAPFQQRPRAANSGEKTRYSGPLPQKPLRFVQYLYYSGLIDWQTMIDAITWQSKVRPRIGEIGRNYRFLDHGKIIEVIKRRRTGEFFGNVALRSGFITRPQLLTMIGKQKNLDLPIGRYFVEHDLFERDELATLIHENNERNAWFRRNL